MTQDTTTRDFTTTTITEEEEEEEKEDVAAAAAAAENITDAQSEEDRTPWHLFSTVCPTAPQSHVETQWRLIST